MTEKKKKKNAVKKKKKHIQLPTFFTNLLLDFFF